MLVFPVCVALTLSSRRRGPCVSAHRSVPSAPLTESAQWTDGWMKSEPFLLLHLFSVCVAWQSSLTRRHREGHIFYCRQQKIPRLGLKTSNFKYSTDVNCISDAVTFFMLPVAYVTGRWHLSANLLYCGWTAAGLTGLWHRRCGLESHGQFRFSYNNVISRYCLAWKISLWKALCVLKAVVWNLHVQNPLC